MARISRRGLLQLFGAGAGSAFVSAGVTACNGAGSGTFDHGVASGDPLSDRVILWTRFTPTDDTVAEVVVAWQVATDAEFESIVVQGEGATSAARDFTIKVDATGLSPATTYHYRFMVDGETSSVGTTRTLPEGSVDQVRFLVFSCANYPAGYFHVYAEATAVADVDAVLHLGDYIYEYGPGGYASADAEALDRVVDPPNELLTLDDYRRRYAQYRTDQDLQSLHLAVPFIAVWDDHEVANDAWRAGAENHDPDAEGDFGVRLGFALQAYAEWMPIRPAVDDDVATLQRNFEFGDLVHLMMLDTRLVARDQQLDFGDFILDNGNVDNGPFVKALNDPTRTLLGTEQRDWVLGHLADHEATWQVLGQQVLMGIMELPAPVLPRDLSDPSSAPLTFDQYILLAEMFFLQQRINAEDPTLTKKELQFFEDNRRFFIQNVTQLLEPNVPYNLDAWDGYGAERDMILGAAVDHGRNLVVLAGDTHNAWANNLELGGTTAAGVEFATAGVSSPGLEAFLGIIDTDDPTASAESFESNLPLLVTRLKYSNLLQRGFLTVTFTSSEVTADWTYVSTVKEATYTVVEDRNHSITVAAGVNAIA